MLSTITCSKNKKYSFFVKTEVFDEIELIITDGKNVWINNDEINERKITYESRPQSRKKETKLSYLNSVKNALIVNPNATVLPNTTEYFYEISDSDNGIINLALKEKLPNTTLTTILYKGSFIDKLQLADDNSLPPADNPMMSLLQLLATINHEKEASIKGLENTNKEFQQLLDKNTNDIKLLNEFKENLQNQMLSKMCVVLNSKKREIQNLREQLGEAEPTKKVDVDEDVMEVEEVAPKATKTTAARGRKPVAKKEVAPKPPPKRATKSKSGVEKLQSSIKSAASKRTAGKSKRKTVSSDEDEIDEDDDHEEEDGDEAEFHDGDTEEEEKGQKKKGGRGHSDEDDDDATELEEDEILPARKKARPNTNASNKTSSTGTGVTGGFDFDRIKRLAQEFEKKDSNASAKPAGNDSDATVDNEDSPVKKKKPPTNSSAVASSKFLVNPKGVEVDGSQIMGFLSSSSQPQQQSASSAAVGAKATSAATAGNGDGDDTNDDASVSIPIVPVMPTKRTFLGFTEAADRKKSKSRKLLDDSDSD